jgi:hypothetical protein
VVYDAFHSQHLPYIAAALNLKVHTGLRKVNHHHLVEIIKNDDMPALKYIIRKGYMDVNRYWYSYSPLTPAVHLGSINAVRELLKAGANPDGSPARRTYQHSPLRIAVVNENLPMAKLLLQYGPDPNGIPSTCGIVLRSPLYIAVKKQNRSMVEMLLQNGARVNGHSGSISNDRKMIFRHAMKMETVRRIRTYETKTDTNSEARKNVFFIKKVVVPPYGSIYEAILRADEQEQAEAEQTIENEENLDVDVDLVNG